MKASILTSSGSYFDFLRPEESKITIEDIAHALAQICRFTGHTLEFYSVAQHSVHCSYLVPPEHAFTALMHDAAEAYVGDMSAPLKHLVGDAYRLVEQRVEREIARRFGYEYPFPQCVKDADLSMLATEKRYLMHPHSRDDLWSCSGHQEWPWGKLTPWSSEDAEMAFIERFHELNTLLARNL